jgi:hypothetical protein
MKQLSIIFLLLFSFTISYSQDERIKSMVDSLDIMKADTLDCNADLYWRIIAQGEKAIPFLIDKLTDTTPTNIKFLCKETKLNVGEVAYFALEEIGHFPLFLVTKIQFDYDFVEGCEAFYTALFRDSFKPRFQKNMRDWYAKEKKHYRKEPISKENQTLCQKKYGINSHYMWKED